MLKLAYVYTTRKREQVELNLYFEAKYENDSRLASHITGFKELSATKKRKILSTLKNSDGYG